MTKVRRSNIPETLHQQLSSNTAIQSPEHLKRWLQETGRRYLVLRTDDLVDALPWPDGVDALIQVLEAYRQQRLAQPVEHGPCPQLKIHRPGYACTLCRNTGEVVIRSKDDILEDDERQDAIAFLQSLEG